MNSNASRPFDGALHKANASSLWAHISQYLKVQYLAGVIAVAAFYLGISKLGLQLSVTRPTLMWAPSGFALGILLVFGVRYWPGAALGALIETLTTGAPLFFAFGTAVGAAVAPVAAIWALTRFVGFRTNLTRVRDVLGVVLIGALGSTLISTFLGISSRCVITSRLCSAYVTDWWVWWLGEAIGVIVVTPLVLAWIAGPIAWRGRRLAEGAVLTVAILVVGRFAFGDWSASFSLAQELPLVYFNFPLLLWAVFRFGQRGAASATALVVVLAMWGTARGYGPFVSGTLDDELLLLWVWVFATLVAVTTMLLAAVIAERELAVEESHHQREFATQVMNAMGQGVTVTDDQGRFEFVNPAYADLVGRPASRLIGARPDEITPWDGHPPVDTVDFAGRAGEKFTFEVRVARPDARVVYALVTRTPRLRGDQVVGSITVVTDVTESKRAQEALRASELRFRTMFQRHQAAMVLIDHTGSIVDANPAAETLYGHSRDELRGMTVADLAGRPLAETLQSIAPQVKSQPSVVLPARLPDGDAREVEVYSSPIEYGEGELLFLIVHDVTERELAQKALRASEERYRDLVELSPEPIVVHADNQLVYANPAAVRLLGAASAREIIGKRLIDFVHPDSRDEYLKRRRQFEEGEEGEEPERASAFRLQRVDGRVRDVEVASGPIDFGGAAARQIVIRDVTQRRRAEAALRESEAQLRTLVDYAPEAIVVLDVAAGRFVHVNENAVRLFGHERNQLRRMGLAELSPPAQPDGQPSAQLSDDYVQRAVEGDAPVFEWIHRNARGDDIPCEVHLVRMPATGRVLIRGSITDIRERKRLEEQLMQSQKMEAIGRLAGGIAHDFNNLTTAILGYGELTLEAIPEDDALRPNLDQIQKAANRAADLTRQLLAFARKQVVQPKVIVLNSLVRNVEDMLRRLIGEHIELISKLDPDLKPVRVDPGQFEQVLLNLAVNARDAMPGGGRLTIETCNVALGADFVAQQPAVIPGPYVLVRVSDTGVGIDEETIKHVFEPFFTTKARTKGTGLGLATCYGIVKQAGGYIFAGSRVGQGAVFDVYVPRDDEEPVSPSRAATPATAADGAETILLVEDEQMVMAMVEKILRVQGYEVITAHTGEEALRVAAERGGDIDLLLTDVVMPRVSGGELARRLTATHPEMKVLFMSGYTEDTAIHQGRLEDDAAFLQKPFSPRVLAERVRDVLDRV